MRPEVMTLFRQVAELPQAERAGHYARQQVPDDVRREVESLLQFDWTNEVIRDDSGSAGEPSIDASSAHTGSPAANRTVAPPERIGRFQVERLIGRGGMGQVYLARDPVIGRRVAIKLIAAGVENETARRRLVREARTAGRLRHPNIVTVFEAGEHDEQPFIAMEFVPGRTLRSLITRREPLALRQRLAMIEGACAGLAHAHREGVVHLDIKPDNLVLDESGIVKVLDFGISRSIHADTLTLHVAGTLRYMSPEQIQGKELDQRSDTFSLGCALFELVAYEPAFSGSTSEIVTQIAYGPVPRLADSVPGVHPVLDRIVTRAMSLDPSERYADLDELRGELAGVRLSIDPASDLPMAPPARSGPVERPPSRIPRSSAPISTWRPTPVSMAAIAGVVTVLAAGVGLSIQAGLLGPGTAAREPVVPAAPAASAPPSVSTASPADDVWRLLARGERAAVLARLDASPDAALARAVVDTVRATVLRSREAASAGAGTSTYRNGEEQMTRATALAAGGRMTDALRALWQAGDLYARTSPAPAATTAPAATATQAPAGTAAPAAAGPPPAIVASPASEVAAPQPPAPTSTTSIPAAVPERPAVATAPAAAPAPAPSDTQAIIDVLRRYDAAYEALDVAAVQRVFPSLDRAQVDTLRRTFEGVTRYERDTRAGRVDVAGDTATVHATVASRITPRFGDPRPLDNESNIELRLRRAGNDWVIVSVTTR